MNQSQTFIRKIIYIALIGALSIPLAFVSRPETRDSSGNIKDPGGNLSRLRDNYELSQAKLSEIDPASETMKLASLGLRGIAVSALWLQAMDQKKREEYDKLETTVKALTKIQPNFVKVWEFQAHNLAYNVSMEFDDYEYRYHWVKKGIEFLKDGVDYNKTNHRITDSLGFFTGNKMGKSDEKDSFRRLFRSDKEFHQAMSDFIEPETYDLRGYGPDSWKMAYQWYDYSRQIVNKGIGEKQISDMLFYMYRPAQLRNQGMSLQEEFRTDEKIQDVWTKAFEQWIDYGNEPITNTLNVTHTMEGMAKYEKELELYRKQLDELTPGVRQELVGDLLALAGIPAEDMEAWKLASDQRNDEQIRAARAVNEKLQSMDQDLDSRIAEKAKPDDQLKARRLVTNVERLIRQMQTIDRDSSTINYTYWRARTSAESADLTVAARQALFDAEEMRRKSIYDDEFDRDLKSGKITITKRGALSLYLDVFKIWSEVLEQHPGLKTGPTADDLVDKMKEFRDMLVITNREWPENFPLQSLIDFRAADGNSDELPTTEDLVEKQSVLEVDEDEEPTDSENSSNAPPIAQKESKPEISNLESGDTDDSNSKEAEPTEGEPKVSNLELSEPEESDSKE